MTPDEVLSARRLPGASLAETALVQAYVRDHPRTFERYEANVHLGLQGFVQPPGTADEHALAAYLTAKKIDLVGYALTGITIFEVKVRAGLASIGQLQGYRVLWQHLSPQTGDVALAVIAHHLDLEMAHVLTQLAIPFCLYPDLTLPGLVPLPA